MLKQLVVCQKEKSKAGWNKKQTSANNCDWHWACKECNNQINVDERRGTRRREEGGMCDEHQEVDNARQNTRRKEGGEQRNEMRE